MNSGYVNLIPAIWADESIMELPDKARWVVFYLIHSKEITTIPIFKSATRAIRNNFNISQDEWPDILKAIAKVGITLEDDYWVIDSPYTSFKMYNSPKNDRKVMTEIQTLPKKLQQRLLTIHNVNAKLGDRDVSKFVSGEHQIRSWKKSEDGEMDEPEPLLELKETAIKDHKKESYLLDMTPEILHFFAEKYKFSEDTIRREAERCVDKHRMKNPTKPIDWHRAFKFWLSTGWVKEGDSKSSPYEVPFTDLSHLAPKKEREVFDD